jgi:hypothetical protein
MSEIERGHTSRTISATKILGGIIAMAWGVTGLRAWIVDGAVGRDELPAEQDSWFFEMARNGCVS